MDVTRREIVRRLGGLSALAALFGGSRLVSDADATGSGLSGSETDSTLAVQGGGKNRDRGTNPGATAPGRAKPNTSTTTTDPALESSSTNPPGPGSSSTTESGPGPDESPSTTSTVSRDSIEISGRVGPYTVPKGVVAHIVGDVTLEGDLVVEGTLTGIDSFTLEGNGHQIMAQFGGRVRLVGRRKTGWARVGEAVSGWSNGDRLAVAPTAAGVYMPKESTWGGSWGSIGAPAPVTLLDGRKMQAEVANLTRSITLRNLARLILLDQAGPSEFRHIALVDCGADPLGFYPLHFHLNGGSVAGSIVEGVVVEGGRNRAFVPHGSDGVRFMDCVAYRTTKRPYWWDENEGNESEDISYEKCLAMAVFAGPGGEEKNRLAGFQLGAALRSKAVDCAVVAVQGQDDSGGFWWPAGESIAPWDFRRNVAHNNVGHGFIVWQNTGHAHFLEDSVAYRNSGAGVDHGAYRNAYRYTDIVLQENADGIAVKLHANAREDGQTFSGILTDGLLFVDDHKQPPAAAHRHLNSTYTGVVYREKDENPSHQEFIDCGLEPDDFDLSGIHAQSSIVIKEGSRVTARWSGGSWS
jgi:hypothetical protein